MWIMFEVNKFFDGIGEEGNRRRSVGWEEGFFVMIKVY